MVACVEAMAVNEWPSLFFLAFDLIDDTNQMKLPAASCGVSCEIL
jgi:hypothetical protein